MTSSEKELEKAWECVDEWKKKAEKAEAERDQYKRALVDAISQYEAEADCIIKLLKVGRK